MGAEQFENIAPGNTAQEAFNAAYEDAAYDYGHAGYTGTIAEKSGFTLFHLAEGSDPRTVMDALSGWYDDDEKKEIVKAALGNRAEEAAFLYDDKWGNAVCFPLGDGTFLFGGWASC